MMDQDLRNKLAGIVGAENLLPGEVVRARPPAWNTHQPCLAHTVVLPASTGEVADVLAACYSARQSVVTYGGVTNLVQGCATTPEDLVLDLARMNAIEEIDTTALTMTAQAGLILRNAQEAADAEGLIYPVDIGARDNCTLGGNVSTNAGGSKVIRYGMTRDSVLGIEAVLADGTVLSSMNRYIKNNSGFDLKHLFIGTEGVLGVVTRVVMRLANKPQSHNVALLACNSYDDTVRVLNEVRARLGSALCGFEVMWNSFYEHVVQPKGQQAAMIAPGQYCYVLIEAMGSNPDFDDDVFAATMEALFTSGSASDGVLAKSGQEREAMWAVRHDVEWIVSGAQNFDISLRISDVGNYVESLTRELGNALPTAHVAAFGHLGDNNLHISVVGEYSASERDVVEHHVYHLLKPYSGAISAEHGIGLEKRGWLPLSRSSNEIATMRALKRTLDPRNLLNPGKVVGTP